jgi:glycosyltransferase involved in cell wall biosynthesis
MAAKMISKDNFDMTIAFFSIPCGIVARMLLAKFHTPYCVLLRGGDVPGFLHRELSFFHWITMPFTKVVWKNAQRIIANSSRLCELANKTAATLNRKVEIVPNGVDVSIFKPVKHDCKNPFVFLFVGRFVNQKNLLLLLSQFEMANREMGARLVLAGEGPEKERMVQKIEASPILKNSVYLKSWTVKKDLPSVYQSAHCFVNPSMDEGMPNAVLEAMACGLPVIASNVGGNNELVVHEKSGYLFNLEEKDSLSFCMKKMASDIHYDSMGLNARVLVESRYSWSVSALSIIKENVNAV